MEESAHQKNSKHRQTGPGKNLPVLNVPSESHRSILNLAARRVQRGNASPDEYWRSLDELADTPEFRAMLHREFPPAASEWNDPLSRRRFLHLMGASLALAGMTACTQQPAEYIVPYVKPPEGIIPGKPQYYATAMPFGGAATGLLVESREGRPIKIEGNPDHPASLGATDIFAQASLLTLYDPDRSQTVNYLGEISTWSAFLGEVGAALESQRGTQGAGLRILTETVVSPTLAAQLRELLRQFPAAKWHQYEAVNRDNAIVGAQLAFGQPMTPLYRFENADVILAVDSDFLSCGPGSLRYAREFARRRRVSTEQPLMNRLYVIESTPNSTGAVADHRLPLRPAEIENFVRAVAAALGVPSAGAAARPDNQEWFSALVRDLQNHRGRSLIIVGDEQPPFIHALAHAINQTLGNNGQTVQFIDPVEASPVEQMQSLRELAGEMEAGRVELLIILGGNPVHTAPADLNFAARLSKVRLRVHLGLYNDETSELCHWHIPESHYLESWSDARAFDGTASIIQPLILPLYQSKSAHELLAALTGQPDRSSYDLVRDYWKANYRNPSNKTAALPVAQNAGAVGGAANNRAQTTAIPAQSANAVTAPKANTSTQTPVTASTPSASPAPVAAGSPSPASDDFEKFWRKSLNDGVIAGSAFPLKTVTAASSQISSPNNGLRTTDYGHSITLLFRPDPAIYDGRFANNGWLQELPRPLTKLTWDNAALMSPSTATRLGVDYRVSSRGGERGEIHADVIELSYQGRSVRAPVWIVPGHADNCITVHLGYGRWRAGRAGNGAGFNANVLRSSDHQWTAPGVEIKRTGDTYQLACTQFHYNMEGREIVRAASLDEFQRNPKFAHEKVEEPTAHESLYPEYEYKGYAWGMAIDLNSCTGCNACVIACQAENNIPVVGREQVLRGRAMHWLRIDRYYKGAVHNPETFFQPLPCMHCEKAPCEVVCPVNATVHDTEGLNVMVYNRCVGTRYCSNNCPYKVRRFNFLLYQDWDSPSLRPMRNPEVSVRSRGVMEKCTYCVQRIQHAKIESEKENRTIRDGEVVTACQAACPTEAIVFGNINDHSSQVAKLKASPRNYGLLAELQTQPRTTYLAAVRNPNPEINHTPQEAMK
ncbi:MAG TPA: TAT-variant-translocated molybdopterin oxidoreductase [Blastocatellia bacterium]|nr:TAT-variant-translocated molybdopterin oxidoreductase [Blastocatellia bacterium]